MGNTLIVSQESLGKMKILRDYDVNELKKKHENDELMVITFASNQIGQENGKENAHRAFKIN